MPNDLRWTERASDEYERLMDYLLSEWGEQISLRVRKEIDQTITRIQNSPEHFPIFRKIKKIRRCVASPQTSVYFKLAENVVEIISVFDSRQNPRKLKL
ncbi:MAG TPA: type II toxin-antitoxin system RelE/ParE family toxin [Mucilaginibacter sp.]|jgi:plasmid stabilization system protein ParE